MKVVEGIEGAVKGALHAVVSPFEHFGKGFEALVHGHPGEALKETAKGAFDLVGGVPKNMAMGAPKGGFEGLKE